MVLPRNVPTSTMRKSALVDGCPSVTGMSCTAWSNALIQVPLTSFWSGPESCMNVSESLYRGGSTMFWSTQPFQLLITS